MSSPQEWVWKIESVVAGLASEIKYHWPEALLGPPPSVWALGAAAVLLTIAVSLCLSF